MSLENLEALSLSSSQLIKMLQSLVPRGPILHDYDRPVAAILVDGNGDLMAYGLNCNSLNKTLHAEVNLVQKYVLEHRQPIPFGSKIYVSHKPCKMCASMIFDCSLEREKVFVYYGDVPEGRMSTWTTLDEWSLNAQDPSLLS